MVVVLVINIST